MANARVPSVLYSKEDLDILYLKKQYREYLQHAKDIRPSLRNEEWQTQALEMSKLLLDDLIKNGNYSSSELDQVESLLKLARVKEDEIFLLKRKEYIKTYLEKCFQNDQVHCVQSTENLFKNSPKREELPDIPAALGLILLENQINETTIIGKYFENAFISERSKFLCQKPEVRKYILHWFKKFNEKSRSLKDIKLFTADSFHPSCIESVLNYYISHFPNIRSPIDREQIIYWLKSIDYISDSEIDTLLAIFVLNGPVNGEIFNLAWNKIKNLGENYKQRAPIIKKLITLDPLPDTIFGMSDPLREKTLFNLVQKNLPEYVDHYSKRCLNYYSGQKRFPNGNPTINCKDFYRLLKTKNGPNHPRVKMLEATFRL